MKIRDVFLFGAIILVAIRILIYLKRKRGYNNCGCCPHSDCRKRKK